MGAGLIPAHAGKTLPDSTRSTKGGAHPRSRGENVAYTFNPTTQAGSSPLTRGKLPEDPHDTCVLGLIPAHAGKTRSVASMSTVRPAHPRSRGENGPLPAEGMELDGSSPLTRGKPSRL